MTEPTKPWHCSIFSDNVYRLSAFTVDNETVNFVRLDGRKAKIDEDEMKQYNIAVLIGSLRKDSFNKKLAEGLSKLAPAEFTFKQIEIGDLPLYNQDDETSPAPSVTRLKEDITNADGLLFVTPEYNRSVPAVLKNALDHASRPYGESVWNGKPAAVIGASIGPSGAAMAQQHLRNILACLNVPTLGQPEGYITVSDGLFGDNGEIGSASRDFFQGWVDTYAAWIKKFASA